MESPFDALGVNPDADEATVVSAYRRRVKETHPDQGGSAAEFKRVQDAYGAIQAGDAPSTEVPDAEDIDTGGENGAADASAGDQSTQTAQEEAVRMAYLDYEVAAEHGWELDDDDLFRNAADAGLDPDSYGRLLVQPGETILEPAEEEEVGDHLVGLIRESLPDLVTPLEPDTPVVRYEACPMADTTTPDARAIIDAPAEGPDGLVIAAGFHGAGVMAADSVGTGVRALVTGEDAPFPLDPFRLHRFETRSADFPIPTLFEQTSPDA